MNNAQPESAGPPSTHGNTSGTVEQIALNRSDLASEDWALVAFDLDDTLAPSKSALPTAMGEALRALLDVTEVAVISGGALPQFESQLLTSLDADDKQIARLHLMPTCGTRYLEFEGQDLVERYAYDLSEEDRLRVCETLEEVARQQGIWEEESWGPILEDRGSQITYSALGQKAPLEAKRNWDPTGEKKARLARAVAERLPHLEVRSGGSTSVDVTEKGIDKAYGMNRLIELTGIPKESMVFIGDRLDPVGNDYPVKAAGWPTFAVSGWEETLEAVRYILGAKTKANDVGQ